VADAIRIVLIDVVALTANSTKYTKSIEPVICLGLELACFYLKREELVECLSSSKQD